MEANLVRRGMPLTGSLCSCQNKARLESGTYAKVSSWPVSAWHEARMHRDADGRSWLDKNYEQHSESPLMMAIRGLYEALAAKLHGETFCFFQVSGLTSQYGFSWWEPLLFRLGLKEMWVAAAYDDYSVEDIRRVLKERIGSRTAAK